MWTTFDFVKKIDRVAVRVAVGIVDDPDLLAVEVDGDRLGRR